MSYLDDLRVLFAAERTLLTIGARVSVVSALQFRSVLRSLGVWLNFLLAVVALALAVHFVTSS